MKPVLPIPEDRKRTVFTLLAALKHPEFSSTLRNVEKIVALGHADKMETLTSSDNDLPLILAVATTEGNLGLVKFSSPLDYTAVPAVRLSSYLSVAEFLRTTSQYKEATPILLGGDLYIIEVLDDGVPIVVPI